MESTTTTTTISAKDLRLNFNSLLVMGVIFAMRFPANEIPLFFPPPSYMTLCTNFHSSYLLYGIQAACGVSSASHEGGCTIKKKTVFLPEMKNCHFLIGLIHHFAKFSSNVGKHLKLEFILFDLISFHFVQVTKTYSWSATFCCLQKSTAISIVCFILNKKFYCEFY